MVRLGPQGALEPLAEMAEILFLVLSLPLVVVAEVFMPEPQGRQEALEGEEIQLRVRELPDKVIPAALAGVVVVGAVVALDQWACRLSIQTCMAATLELGIAPL